jgi:hypothetical protein
LTNSPLCCKWVIGYAYMKNAPIAQRYRMKLKTTGSDKGFKTLYRQTNATVIWVFFNVVIFYLYYAIFQNKIDIWVWICIGLVLLEGLILLIFNRICPITIIARKYSDSVKDNFDIFLPNWLAKYTKLIYTFLFTIAFIILLLRLLVR